MPLRRFLSQIALAALLASGTARAADGDLEIALQAFDAGNYAKAAPLLRSLAEAGNSAAQHRLSVLYFYGKGVPENERTAMDLAKQSAARGNTDAMYFLGTMFVFGDDAPKLVDDPDREAAKWYFEAARKGHADAEYGLGLMFLAGKGVVQDQAEALKWTRKAAEHGHPGARSFVASHSEAAK